MKSGICQPKSSASHEKKRQQILRNMEKAMGKLPDRSDLPPFDIKIIDSVMEDRFTRGIRSVLLLPKMNDYLFICMCQNKEVLSKESRLCLFYMEQVYSEKVL
jgi:hypothetical protein